MSLLKQCKICNEEKSLDNFYKDRVSDKGVQYYGSYCKPCFSKKSTKYHYNNWEKHKKHARKSYHNRKDQFWNVYLIPSINYVGKTNFLEDRQYPCK